MAEVNVTIHGKTYGIACDNGQERRVQELTRYVDARLREIASAGAASNESHLLVLTALVMADEIFDMKMAVKPVIQEEYHDDLLNEDDERMIVEAINHLAARIDSVADRLQKI
jgi:cell division protein ZapA